MRALKRSAGQALVLCLAVVLSLLLSPANAAFITFENCLESSRLDSSDPKLLQFTPLFVNATFDRNATSHLLNLTIYGNVSGQQFDAPYPPPNSPDWQNPNETQGKITNLGAGNDKLATLTSDYGVLTYTVFNNATRFCGALGQDFPCPLGPSFNANASDPATLPRFNLTYDFGSSYAFSTISSTIQIISGDNDAPHIGCISAQITPGLGSSITGLLTWLPAAILTLKGFATLSAAIWSPWGSSDIFRWSSNYGRDEDLLRLVTPGFGDCLQYIQFVFLTGSLTLQYPGFFQPAVRQAAWSTLLFNESFVSGGNGTVSLVDGLYATNATYGLTKMSQYIGMTEDQDIWACMAIWLLVIAGLVMLLCQLGFLGRWIFRMATRTSEEDLRSKNMPFTFGNIIRLLFNYFILPIVALSLFQLVISPHSPASVIACAVVLLGIILGWAAWILKVIFSTKPRTLLFDDMPILLLYGPFYNTYSDSAAPFALVPVFITFMRGVAIGAVQPSGIGQIIILAICEVILILTLNGFRPFQGQTSMNLYHTFFASVRLVTVLLMVAFVPSLGVTEAPKGWIGYVILLLHACVLVFGFFLNAAQTIIEVLARTLGAGHDAHNGAIRGSVLSWRMLKKRRNRPDQGDRSSMMSSAAILRAETNQGAGARSRSVSASSQQLLNRMSAGFENFSSANEPMSSPDPESANPLGTMSTNGNVKPVIATKAEDNYYRPPRARKATLDAMAAPGIRTRSTADFPYQDSPGQPGHARGESYDSTGVHGSPAPAYFRQRTESGGDELVPRTDYAVREVDQYYRGPALNDHAGRKLKTGPADPEGPASTAQSWFQKLVFGVKGKKKDQSKGFEVVRSARIPPGMQQQDGTAGEAVELQQSPAMTQDPYRDLPDSPLQESQVVAGAERGLERSISPTDEIAQQPPATSGFDFGLDGTRSPPPAVQPESETINMGSFEHPVLLPISTEHRASMGAAANQRRLSQETVGSQYTGRQSSHYPEEESNPVRYSDQPVPALDPIDLVGTIDLPSRFNSTAGSHAPSRFNSNAGSHNAPGRMRSTTDRSVPSRMQSSRSGGGMSHFSDGQDWLHAVDNIEWNHEQRPGSSNTQAAAGALSHQGSQQSFRYPAPSVPRRNSRRTLSQEQTATRYHPQQGNIFEGFDSSGTTPPDMGSPAEEQPPNHTHRVVHHRAADSITRNSLGASAAMQGSSAEFFGHTPPNRDEDILK